MNKVNTVNVGGYNINADQVREIETLDALKADPRFFHQHAGKEREALCKELFEMVHGKKK